MILNDVTQTEMSPFGINLTNIERIAKSEGQR